MIATRPPKATPKGTPEARTLLMNEITSRDIYDEHFAGLYTWPSFQVRLVQLRNGWTQKRRKTETNPYTAESETHHPPQLTEGRDWRKIGTTVVYTKAGRRRIIALLKGGKGS